MGIKRLITAAIVLALAACSGDASPVGVWSNPKEVITFSDDGVVVIESATRPVQGTWRMLDDNRFILTVSGFGSVSLYGCKAKSLLRLRLPNGETADYQKGRPNGVTMSTERVWDQERTDCEP